jgi:uncharacterized repeat protein (TIGR01451 family)
MNMKRNLLLVVATLALATSTTLWTGCASWSHREQGSSAAQPAAATKSETYSGASNEFTLKSDLLQVSKRVPAKATLGSTIEADVTIVAVANCANVMIVDMIPAGSSYVKSEPPAQVDGKKLTWNIDTMDKGQTIHAKIWYKADSEGSLVNCATMAAIPRGCAVTDVGIAKLAITCALPATARVGDAVNKVIEVRNVGTAAANDVVISDTLPEGLTAAGPVTFNIGDLAPGAVKQVTLTAKAAARGQQPNVAVAKAANAEQVKAECSTLVVQPGLNIEKSGTKEQFLGRNATYDIVVSNTGDTALTGVSVTDTAPMETKIVSASGASVSGNTATWTVSELAAGAKQNFNVVLTSGTPGSHCNGASVRSSDNLSGSAEACTLWKGVAAILLETKDDPDPIQMGESVTYTIRVTNQGTADDTNVKIVAKFQKEIDPVSAEGGTVDGKTVTFAAIPRLAAKQVVTYTITGKGIATGDHRLNVELTSDILTEPVTHEESTHVY